MTQYFNDKNDEIMQKVRVKRMFWKYHSASHVFNQCLFIKIAFGIENNNTMVYRYTMSAWHGWLSPYLHPVAIFYPCKHFCLLVNLSTVNHNLLHGKECTQRNIHHLKIFTSKAWRNWDLWCLRISFSANATLKFILEYPIWYYNILRLFRIEFIT